MIFCKTFLFLLAILFTVAASQATAYAQQEDVDWARVDAAVKKACEWLKSKQEDDGSWKQKEDKNKLYRENFVKEGLTALCLHALSCAGESADSDCMKRGIENLRKKPFRRTYHAALQALCPAPA